MSGPPVFADHRTFRRALDALAEALPHGRHEVLVGDHVSALADPSLGARLGRVLSEREDGSR